MSLKLNHEAPLHAAVIAYMELWKLKRHVEQKSIELEEMVKQLPAEFKDEYFKRTTFEV